MSPENSDESAPHVGTGRADNRWLRDSFDAAMEQPEESRLGWVRAHVSDPTQQASILRLIAAERENGALDLPSMERAARIGHDREFSATDLVGIQVGAFTLVRLLGQGGMATVYLGERADAEFRQTVAVKLLRHGLYSEVERRLFRRERKALASLTHPNIARMIDGGVTETGVPYLVLEFVDGLPITDFVALEKLALRDRLRLFVVVCRAVDAAHHNLIVHRDIKPSNILVDTQGQVKLLDFGIAKLLADDQDDATRPGAVALTPGYAAPEQFEGGAISTATDVYALGVLLHEMLLDIRPSWHDTEPRKPSTLVIELEGDARIPAMSRANLRQALRGDLDNIVTKALAGEPGRRYASAGAFADDVERHLAAQPVIAHPSSNWYRTQKFVRRHRGGVILTSLFASAVIASLGLAIWQARVARSEAQRANAQTIVAIRQAERAESVRDFLIRVFSAAEPGGPRLAPPSVADVVRVSIADAQRSTTLEPSVRVELIEALGKVLREQGDLDGSLALLKKNRASAVSELGVADPAAVVAGIGLAEALAAAGQRQESRDLYETLLKAPSTETPIDVRVRLLTGSVSLAIDRFERERAFEESSEAMALCADSCSERMHIETLLVRGNVFFGFQEDAKSIPVLEQALALQRHLYAGPHVAIAATQQLLSRAQRRLGRLDKAEQLAREALATTEASVPDPHSRRSDALDTVWQLLIDERKLDEAEAIGKRVIAMDEATLGVAHPGLATSHATLGYTYLLRDKFIPAIAQYRAALAISEPLADGERRSAIYRSQLGAAIGRGGQFNEGLALIDKSLGILEAQSETDWGEVCAALEKRGNLQRLAGQLIAASSSYRRAQKIYQEKLPNAPPEWRVVALVGLGRTLQAAQDPSRAALVLGEAIDLVPLREDQMSSNRIEARAVLALVKRQLGDEDAADRLLAQALSESELMPNSLSPELKTLLEKSSAEVRPGAKAR
ncbi:MAG: serine/threonine-protein kinase [Dokdonella sp.]